MKTGDYVEVLPGVHDDRMPAERRDCLIVELKGVKRDQAVVMFHSGVFLKFHVSQLNCLVKA